MNELKFSEVPLSRDDAELGQVSAKRIDRLGSLAHDEVAGAE